LPLIIQLSFSLSTNIIIYKVLVNLEGCNALLNFFEFITIIFLGSTILHVLNNMQLGFIIKLETGSCDAISKRSLEIILVASSADEALHCHVLEA
jgi:hypothetical protein